MQAGVADTVDPSHWPTDMKTRFFLWFADSGIVTTDVRRSVGRDRVAGAARP